MNIIHTHEDYNDYSGSRSLKLLSEELVRRGHHVRVFTSGKARINEVISGVAVERFPISGNRVRGIRGDKKYKEEYKERLKDTAADIVLNYAAQSWTTDLAFDVLSSIVAKKIFIPCGYSRLHRARYKRYFETLSDYLRKYDHIVYLSRGYRDKRFGEERGAHATVPYSVISNFADEREFEAREVVDFRKKYFITTPYLVLSVSNHYVAKNHPLIFRIARAIGRKDVTFALVGRAHAAPWRGCQIFCRVAGRLSNTVRLFDAMERSDVVAAYRGADIFLHTSLVECDPIVMYEAFAAQTPMVATPSGSIPEFSDIVTIEKDPAGFARAINALLNNKSERNARAEQAHILWKEKYTFKKIADAYEHLYVQLAGTGRTS